MPVYVFYESFGFFLSSKVCVQHYMMSPTSNTNSGSLLADLKIQGENFVYRSRFSQIEFNTLNVISKSFLLMQKVY
jgi:hypothetical protein